MCTLLQAKRSVNKFWGIADTAGDKTSTDPLAPYQRPYPVSSLCDREHNYLHFKEQSIRILPWARSRLTAPPSYPNLL